MLQLYTFYSYAKLSLFFCLSVFVLLENHQFCWDVEVLTVVPPDEHSEILFEPPSLSVSLKIVVAINVHYICILSNDIINIKGP